MVMMVTTMITITHDLFSAKRYWQLVPKWASEHDQATEGIAFTMGCVKQFKSKSMVEIGVSAGVTSGALLFAAKQAGGRLC